MRRSTFLRGGHFLHIAFLTFLSVALLTACVTDDEAPQLGPPSEAWQSGALNGAYAGDVVFVDHLGRNVGRAGLRFKVEKSPSEGEVVITYTATPIMVNGRVWSKDGGGSVVFYRSKPTTGTFAERLHFDGDSAVLDWVGVTDNRPYRIVLTPLGDGELSMRISMWNDQGGPLVRDAVMIRKDGSS